MMVYKVVKYFGPSHGWWKDFAKDHWVQPLTKFDSIDGILSPDVFFPQSDEDWEYCVPEDFKTSLIKDKEYAIKVSRNNPGSLVVGVIENEDHDGEEGLLGYDILDEQNHVSLITNWGPHDKDHPLRNFPVANNGLILSYSVATNAVQMLRRSSPESEHPPGSIWAIFFVGA